MGWLRLVVRSIVRPRCPCCGEGALFDGVYRFRPTCAICGLDFEPWEGEWVSPPYIATTIGMLVGFGLFGAMAWYGIGLDAAVPAELSVGGVAALVALAALRPAKAFWLAFLYSIGGVEVSAHTRALLRWNEPDRPPPWDGARVREAERRARSIGRAQPSRYGDVLHRASSLREVLFPRATRPRTVAGRASPARRAPRGRPSRREGEPPATT